jgi:endonuclease YncB( thermonuclease family)
VYEYRARALRVVDGDTLHAELDLGLDVRLRLTLRLANIDAPELPTPEGKAARAWLQENLGVEWFTVRTVKDRKEKYGRYLGVLLVEDPKGARNLNAEMIALGLARPY